MLRHQGLTAILFLFALELVNPIATLGHRGAELVVLPVLSFTAWV